MNDKIKQLFNAVKAKRPVLTELLDKFGKMPLGEYTDSFNALSEFNYDTIQPRDDFIRISSDYAERLLGGKISSKLRKRLENNANLMTANHHCANISDLPVQGTLAYALSEKSGSVVPVFAFGDIPLNNSRYPRGILFANNVKLPVFPDKSKNTLVSAAGPFTEENVCKAMNSAGKLLTAGDISDNQYRAATDILDSIYLKSNVLACKDYSDQAVIISRLVWRLLFNDSLVDGMPELVHIEIERVVRELIKLDLSDPESLMYRMLFSDKLTCNLLAGLDGKYGCWDMEKLKLLCSNPSTHEIGYDPAAGSGTAFFWGIDEKGRRIPLFFTDRNGNFIRRPESGDAFLSGIDDSGNRFNIPYTSGSVIENIEKGSLLPSLFTSFAAVAFARGYRCYGGFMQVDYLTNMRNGLSSALEKSGLAGWAGLVMAVETRNYCTGMIFALFRHSDKLVSPAGAVEIAGHGGFAASDIDRIKSMTLEESNLLGLPRIYRTVFRPDERSEELMKITPDEIAESIRDHLVFV